MRLHISLFAGLLSAACGLWLLGGSQPEAMAQGKQKDKGKKQVVEYLGEPKGFKAGEPARFAVWATKKGWHIRTTTAKKQHQFTGKITIEGGVVTGIESHDLESKGKAVDGWRLHDKRHEINIDFKTNRHIDGIDFQVSPEAKQIRFNLHIDGKHTPSQIFIGRDGHHPDTDPFNVPAHPKK